MAYTLLKTITHDDSYHWINIYYDLISYLGTKIEIKLKITYNVPEKGTVSLNKLESTDSKSPHIKFNIDKTSEQHYTRPAYSITSPATKETEFIEHEKTYELDRSSKPEAFNLEISGKVRLATPTKDDVQTAIWYSSEITIPAAGIVRIYTSSGWQNAIPYVYTSNGWKQTIPYVYTSNGWKIGQ